MKLNLGCGWRDFGPDWIHIDGGEYPHLHSKDIVSLPFKDNSADVIYSSHVIEYFNRTEILDVLKEWYRVLKPNGVLRLAVPDFQVMAQLYVKGEYQLDRFLGPIYGRMSMSGKTIYHRTTYDYESLKNILEFCGFEDVLRYDWKKTDHSGHDDHSQAYLPHLDKENGTLISLNVEAIKRKKYE
jgi:predicted SAM-dependent methyltransferase